MSWSRQSAGQVQPEWIRILLGGGLWQESERRVASERCGKPHPLHGSDPSGLQGGTSLLDLCPKVFRMPFL